MGWLYPVEVTFKRYWTDALWHLSLAPAAIFEPNALAFYRRLNEEAYFADSLVRIAPRRRAIYVMVPKVASTRIRATLGTIEGRYSRRLKPKYWGRIREAQGPRSVGIQTFYRLATDPKTFRFSFVRNPYSRMLGVWAGHLNVIRQSAGAAPTKFAQEMGTFEKFTILASEHYRTHPDQHFLPQDVLTSVPGIDLDFVGRLERFQDDFNLVLSQLGASEDIRRDAQTPINVSAKGPWTDFYTPEIANRVYKMYECDFDRFQYPRYFSK